MRGTDWGRSPKSFVPHLTLAPRAANALKPNVGRNCSIPKTHCLMDMLKFTKFGLVNAALSLIPIFPTWTLFPGVIISTGIGELIGKCETGYEIILWTSITLTIVLVFRYLRQIHRLIENKNEKELKRHFRLFSLGIYTLLNTAILIMLVGTNLACHGDGQTLLMCIISGPIASVGLVILGFLIDLKKGD